MERALSQVRAWVEHPFHIVKNLFRHKKLRYRGLAKNTAQLRTLFALANLVIAKKTLLAQGCARSRPDFVSTPKTARERPSTDPLSAGADRSQPHHCSKLYPPELILTRQRNCIG